jgi:hypothetical protein
MKTFAISLTSFLIYLHAFGQCQAPEDLAWNFEDDTSLEVNFNAPEDVINYEIKLYARYDDSGGTGIIIPLDSLVDSGSAVPGVNSVNLNTESALPPNVIAGRYFFEALIRLECMEGWTSWHQFYVSPHSLRNDPNFICDLPFTTIQYLADGAGFTYTTEFIVPPDTGMAQQITDLGILIDIGHNYNGDLSITLTSPSGSEITLLNFPNGMGGSSGLSLYFDDNADDGSLPDPTQGFVQPYEPLSTFPMPAQCRVMN